MAAVVTPEELEAKLQTVLEAVHVKAADLSDGCGAKFEVLVVSPQFEGKSIATSITHTQHLALLPFVQPWR
jgi:stress-induced morphogen